MERTFDSLIDRIMLHELLTPLARGEAEIEYINNFPLKGSKWISNSEVQKEALMKELNIRDASSMEDWRKNHNLVSEDKFSKYVEYRAKRRLVISEILKNVGETLFLRYKDRLDRVLYSLIRVETEDLAYKLYYEIESREVEFGDMAEAHSCGPEAKTQGIIGPVDLTTPHPEIAARLRTATARQLFSPFKVDEWFSIIRLEYRFESEYNEKTQQFLGNLLLGTKTSEITKTISNRYQNF